MININYYKNLNRSLTEVQQKFNSNLLQNWSKIIKEQCKLSIEFQQYFNRISKEFQQIQGALFNQYIKIYHDIILLYCII